MTATLEFPGTDIIHFVVWELFDFYANIWNIVIKRIYVIGEILYYTTNEYVTTNKYITTNEYITNVTEECGYKPGVPLTEDLSVPIDVWIITDASVIVTNSEVSDYYTPISYPYRISASVNLE